MAQPSPWRSRWRLPSDARFATYGSCFAQHISRALVANGIGWVDAEPAPARCPAPVATAFNYGVYSSRTGNIYSSAQLLHLVRLATGAADPAATEIWEDGGRYFDSLRPAIEPNGFSDPLTIDSLYCLNPSFGYNTLAYEKIINDSSRIYYTNFDYSQGWSKVSEFYSLGHNTSLKFSGSNYPPVSSTNTLFWDNFNGNEWRIYCGDLDDVEIFPDEIFGVLIFSEVNFWNFYFS